jgi:predicted nucleic acid-binding protein
LYIVDELLTLAISRGDKKFALLVSKRIRELIPAGVKKITEEDFDKAWEIFDSYQDKNWSFTDCTSYIFIERSDIKKAFAFDPHFDQFGIVSRQPAA